MVLYEIFAVFYLVFTTFVFIADPSKWFTNKFKGRNIKKIFEKGDDKEKSSIFIYLIFGIVSWLIVVLMMFWTANITIIAKYYVFIFIGYTILSFVISSFKKSKVITKLSFISKSFRYITTWAEILIVLYALYIII